MNKFKNLVSNILDRIKELFFTFPVTLAVIMLTTLIVTIIWDGNGLEKIVLFGLTFSVGTFLVEAFFNKKLFKFLGCLIPLAIALFFTFIKFNSSFRIIVGYCLICILLASYFILRKSKLKFNEYLLKIFANFFMTSIVYSVLNSGLTLLVLVFAELLLNGLEIGTIFLKLEVLLLGLFYIPAIIFAVSNVKNKDVIGFIKGLVKYVMLPLIMVGILIIYLYILKIVILWQMPSNVVFRILAIMFCFAFPIWNMASNFEENNKFVKYVTKILPFTYMPFIVLEIISLGMRVVGYGITPIRYIGIAFIIVQIIALILNTIKNRKYLSQSLIYLVVAIFILCISPLNFDKISLWSQKNILNKLVPEGISVNDLAKEDKSKALGAYYYLRGHDGEKYIPKYLNEEDFGYISSYEIENNYANPIYYDYGYFYDDFDYLDVREYNKIIKVSNYFDEEILTDKNNNKIEKLDLAEFKQDFIESYEDFNEWIKDNRKIKLSDNSELYITLADVTYIKNTKEMVSIRLEGYVLKK